METNETISISLEELIDRVIDQQYEERCQKICVPNYYKMQYLQYAMEHNVSLQCIGKSLVEMLVTGFTFTGNPRDLNNARQLLSYLNAYSDDQFSKSLSSLMVELSGVLYNSFDNIIVGVNNRFKSFRSVLAKVFSKAIMSETLEYYLNNLQFLELIMEKTLKENEVIEGGIDMEKVQIIFAERLKENNKKNPAKDSFGYRYIVFSSDKEVNEEKLISCCYQLANKIQTFFIQAGYDVIEVKDYIKNPKKSSYSSFHFTVEMEGIPVEFQIRTESMDQNAKTGKASHDGIYKDTTLQNFLKDFMYGISKSQGKVPTHKAIGLLESSDILRLSLCKTSLNELPPRILNQVETFPDMDFLRRVHNKI